MDRILLVLAIFLLPAALTGCEAIGTIFEAGVWAGVIMVVLVVLAIFLIVRMIKR